MKSQSTDRMRTLSFYTDGGDGFKRSTKIIIVVFDKYGG